MRNTNWIDGLQHLSNPEELPIAVGIPVAAYAGLTSMTVCEWLGSCGVFSRQFSLQVQIGK